MSKKLKKDSVHFNCDYNLLNNSFNQDVIIDNMIIEVSLDDIV